MRRVVVELLRLARWLLPTRDHVLVHGFPSIEANAVEAVRALLEGTTAKVTWLDGPGEDFRRRQGLVHPERLTVRSRTSPRGLWDYLTAEVVFFTHGFYGAPGSVRRKPVVNLWHGNGAKRAQDDSFFPGRKASGRAYDAVLLAAARWRGEFDTVDRHYDKQVWACGYPRNGVFTRSESRVGETLRHSVLWAPSFRAARVRRVGWSDVAEAEEGDDTRTLQEIVADHAQVLAREGVPLLLRPHPSDADSFVGIDNCELMTDDHLEERGLHLYDVLQGVGGLLSDISSIWVDFLLSGRPVGFVFPDFSQYRRGRGIWPPDIFEHQPELFVEGPDDMARFAAEIRTGRAERFDPARLAAECRTIDPCGGALLLEELRRAGMMRRSWT